ncbi:hypothetical protein ACVWZ6_006354 [Bradyrhizobium sp. GM6.1]
MRRLRLRIGCLRRVELQRRNPDALALLQPILAVDALAVDAQLAFANDALNVGERQAGKVRFKEAIDAHVVLVGRHLDGLHLGRQQCLDGLCRCSLFWFSFGRAPLDALARKARRLRARLAARPQPSRLEVALRALNGRASLRSSRERGFGSVLLMRRLMVPA